MTLHKGIYSGVVVDNDDPEGLRRLRVRVPTLLGESATGWVRPCLSPGRHFHFGQTWKRLVPAVGEGVWIAFEAGDIDHPLWLGTWLRAGASDTRIDSDGPIIDVQGLLTDPSDPTTTTTELEELAQVVSDVGGGTLQFAAGDYHLGSIVPSDEYTFPTGPPWYSSPFDQGGLRLRSGVNLIGAQGSRLVWSSGSSAMIGADAPFDWDVHTTITEDLTRGTTTFPVESTTGFVVGDDVMVHLGQVNGDTREGLWWSFAKVLSIDPGVSLTLDQASTIDLDLGEMVQGSYNGVDTGDPLTDFTGKYDPEIVDAFDRADSTTTLGNADTGETWAYFRTGAGRVGISGNRAYCATVDAWANVAYLDAGEVDVHVKCSLTHNDASGPVFVVCRFDHATFNGYIVLPIGGTSLILGRLDGGVMTPIDTVTMTLPDRLDLLFTSVDDVLKVYLDGNEVMSATDATHSGTEVGFNLNLSGTYVDDFSAGKPLYPNYRAKWIRRILPGRLVENVRIEGFDLVGKDGANRAQSGISLNAVRNVEVVNVSGEDTGGALISVHYCEDVHMRDIFLRSSSRAPGAPYYGRGLSWANARNCTARGLHIEGCENPELLFESNCRNVVVSDVQVVCSNPDRPTGESCIQSFTGAEVVLRNLTIRGAFPPVSLIGAANQLGDRMTIDGLTLDIPEIGVGAGKSAIDLGWVEGALRIRTTLEGETLDGVWMLRKPWSAPFPIITNNLYNLPIIDGIVRRARIYLSTRDGLESSGAGGGYVQWENPVGDSVELTSELAAEMTTELGLSRGTGQSITTFGSNAARALTGRTLNIDTGDPTVYAGSAGPVGPGEWGLLEVEVFVPDLGASYEERYGFYGPDAAQFSGHAWGSVVDIPALSATLSNFSSGYRAVSTTGSLTAADGVVAASGTITLTLPSAAGLNAGHSLSVKNVGTGVVTLEGAASETIDGDLSQLLIAYESMTLVSTGSAWIIV